MANHNSNALPIPFKEDESEECFELLRVWATEENTVVYSANFDIPGLKNDAAIFGAALVGMAHDFALGVERQYGIDHQEFLRQIGNELEKIL